MSYRSIWCVDFEYQHDPGENPSPVCMVARDILSGAKYRVWREELNSMKLPPYDLDSNSLFVCFYAPAELSCHLVLGWPFPTNILDLFAEFRNKTNGLNPNCGNGLVGALAYHGIDSIGAAEKDAMRQKIMSGGPWSAEEKQEILDYCESDVIALERLMGKIFGEIDIPRALQRGRYMKAVSKIEHCGVPIDLELLGRLKHEWDGIKDQLIKNVDSKYGVFEGSSFRSDLWGNWLIKNKIPWPRLDSGRLALDDETFRQMARAYPTVAPIRELRDSLSKMRLADLEVGVDGRNRCMLSPFRSKTGRNQPSNSRFIYGPSVWLRGLIRPENGMAIAYLDWSQQEFGIAAGLSVDPVMMEAYSSGDPYLAFAKQAGAIPPEGSKETHSAIRDQFKACVLAVQYGMGEISLATRLGRSIERARELLTLHRKTFRKFWAWSDAVQDYAMLHNRLWTTFGWNLFIEDKSNPRSLRNFPMQANGAEMLRFACCYLTEAGIRVCAPVHDAILIEAPANEIEEITRFSQALMAKASEVVLSGFSLRSDAKIVRFPDRYQDPRGKVMWDEVMGLLTYETASC
ncbi:MAG: DNA polymerase [Elusimicrobiota bacterium]